VQTTPATLQLPLRTLRRGLGVGRIGDEAISFLRCAGRGSADKINGSKWVLSNDRQMLMRTKTSSLFDCHIVADQDAFVKF